MVAAVALYHVSHSCGNSREDGFLLAQLFIGFGRFYMIGLQSTLFLPTAFVPPEIKSHGKSQIGKELKIEQHGTSLNNNIKDCFYIK